MTFAAAAAVTSAAEARSLTAAGAGAQAAARPEWSLKGYGVVCCPCGVPCPCRNNGQPTYGHCESTLYLHIRKGRYKDVNLDGLHLVGTGGMCASSYKMLSALYFDSSESASRRAASISLMAGLPVTPVKFEHVRLVKLQAEVRGDRHFHISIPGILEMAVDRNWGLSSPPMPVVAAPDYFANSIQYAENLRYRMHDDVAGLSFDYSRRQANYRIVDLTSHQYRTRSMLAQFATGSGWFSPQQMRLIKAQGLQLPDIQKIRETAIRLNSARGAG